MTPQGGYSNVSHGSASIGTASGTVLAAQPLSNYRLLVNDGTAVVYLRFGTAAAVLGQGIRLNANGGNFEMSRALGNLWTGQIMGISGAAAQNIMSLDGLRRTPGGA